MGRREPEAQDEGLVSLEGESCMHETPAGASWALPVDLKGLHSIQKRT